MCYPLYSEIIACMHFIIHQKARQNSVDVFKWSMLWSLVSWYWKYCLKFRSQVSSQKGDVKSNSTFINLMSFHWNGALKWTQTQKSIDNHNWKFSIHLYNIVGFVIWKAISRTIRLLSIISLKFWSKST